jgi:Transposase IS66 family
VPVRRTTSFGMRNRKLADRGDVRLAFYWSHVQRNFYELATPGLAPIASEALKHIAALYAVERDISGAAPTNVAPSGSRKVGHSATLLNCGRGQDKTWLDQSEERACRGPSVTPCRIRKPDALHRRWPHRARQQHRRTLHPPHRDTPSRMRPVAPRKSWAAPHFEHETAPK